MPPTKKAGSTLAGCPRPSSTLRISTSRFNEKTEAATTHAGRHDDRYRQHTIVTTARIGRQTARCPMRSRTCRNGSHDCGSGASLKEENSEINGPNPTQENT